MQINCGVLTAHIMECTVCIDGELCITDPVRKGVKMKFPAVIQPDIHIVIFCDVAFQTGNVIIKIDDCHVDPFVVIDHAECGFQLTGLGIVFVIFVIVAVDRDILPLFHADLSIDNDFPCSGTHFIKG